MSSHNVDAIGTRRRGSSTWPEYFSIPRPPRRTTDNEVPMAAPNQTGTDAFLHSGAYLLTPPCFNWYPLEIFLKSARPTCDSQSIKSASLPKLCLLEDRSLAIDDLQGHDNLNGGMTSILENRTHEDEKFSGVVCRRALDEQEMSSKLAENPYTLEAARRVMLIANITPLCGKVLSDTALQRFAPALKRFLQSHIGGEISFSASVQDPFSPLWNSPKRYQQVEYKFTMAFHISYVALRTRLAQSDPRGLRQSYSMIKPINDDSDDLCYHDAQTSFLITGTNDWQWTAYCLVDNFFGGEPSAETYMMRGQDGPSGGARDDAEPCWDPREYFLLVVSQRFQQISQEWGNFFTVLMSRLDAYESFYIRTIDTNNLCDDASLTRTNSYTKAVSISRQSHDTLSTTLETLHIFLIDTERFFEKKGSQGEDQWRGYFGIIQSDVDHLEVWRRRLQQRMHRFEAMKDGLVSYSALEESRRTTRQGSDIGILTNMTVAYLPFNLAAALFSISSNTPSGRVWAYWAVLSAVLGSLTFYFAFGRRALRVWKRWYHRKPRRARDASKA